jgi:hypothetical protein
MLVRYIDPIGGTREFPDLELSVAAGDVVEVPDDLGERLLEQTNTWERATGAGATEIAAQTEEDDS